MQFSAEKIGSWPSTHFVWNLGIAKSCNIIPKTNPFTAALAEYLVIEKLHDGDIIWIQPHDMLKFVRGILPQIRTHFILVVCNGDISFPGETLDKRDIQSLFNSDQLIHLFTQNGDYDESYRVKFTRIPIGIDFHTLFLRPSGFYETYQSVEEQEATLNSIIEGLLPTNQRRLGALCDFHLNPSQRYGGRPEVVRQLAHLQNQLLWFLPRKIPRRQLWKAKGEFAFSVSPHGGGLDCHRTWEDLALGCIVIVKTSPLDPLYERLPVVIVQNWAEITSQNLEKWVKKYGDALTNPEYRRRLTHEYWTNRIISQKQRF